MRFTHRSPRLSPSILPRHFFLLAFALVACDHGGDGLKGSGTVKTDTRSVQGFTAITLASTGDVTLSQTGTESLSVEAEDNLLPHLTSSVSGGRLTLATDGPIRPTKPIHYVITVKDINRIDVSGAGNVTATQLHTSAIQTEISGAGNVTLAGQADSQDVVLSGAGDYDAARMPTKTAKVVIGGAGNAVIQATDALDAKISGVGNLEYIGDPKLTKDVSGLGSIRKR